MSGTDFFDDDLVQRRGSAKSSALGSATDIVGPARHDEIPARPVSDLNLTRMTKHREEVNAQVATAKVEIERLKRRQTDLEREKQTLEEMSQKQDQYESGKQEMLDRLSASLVALEKLEDQASRQTEIYAAVRQRNAEMLKELQELKDGDWTEETIRDELNKAVALIDAVRKEYVKSQATVEAAGGPASLEPGAVVAVGGERTPALPTSFGAWVKIGVAFCLPLVAVALLILAVCLLGGVFRF